MGLKQQDILPGQHYRPAGINGFGNRSSMIWEVEEITVKTDGMYHARLVRVGDHTDHKLVSVDALLDRHIFEPI